jgi:membrane associated rhomboid family serine protease
VDPEVGGSSPPNCTILQTGRLMRVFPILLGVFLALIVFAVLKVMGFIIKFAAVAAALGFVAGLVIARMLAKR